MRVKVGAIGEMAAQFKELKRQGNRLVAVMEVPGAVPYEIVGSVSRRELRQIAKAALKPSIMSFLLFGSGGGKETDLPNAEEDYW